MNKIIECFRKIRDIPYHIPLALDEEDFCCSGKSTLLLKELEKFGIEARYAVGWFNWEDINLSKFILEVPHDPDCTHTWVEANIKGKWIKLDPSWDAGLKNIFPVAEFDGKNDTILAVPVKEIFSPEKSDKIMRDSSDNVNGTITEDLERNGRFYEELNNYLAKSRG
jgi:hypothetical protein